jgi:putative photosynthetic complex assembly protein 2
MGAVAIAIPYVLFVWWISTGTVLFLIGRSSRHGALLKVGAMILFAASLLGVAASSQLTSTAGAYCVFTCAILLWGAIEISLLTGWITGPRPEPCPYNCATIDRVWFGLQAIAYHEFSLIATAGLVFAVTSDAPDQLGWWTFGALLVLRQSAKINLFLGVPTLNDELLPAQVGFLRSYFAKKPFSALFPLSVTVSTAAAACLAVIAVDAESNFDALCYSLLGTLVALGALEHWFMVLPLPVVDLWRWSVRSAPNKAAPAPGPTGRPVLSVIPGGAATPERPAANNAGRLARQRLEDQFRQAYRERQLASAVQIASERPGSAQNAATGIHRTAEGGTP